jgi:hypothetical protein
MNPYFVGFTVGTSVGLTYELDLDEAIKRSAIVTGLSYGVQTPVGRSIISQVGKTGAIVATDAVSVAAAAATTRTGLAIGGAARLAGGVGAGAVIGYGLGAAAGTGLGYLIDDKRGAQAARELYTGQVSAQQYQATLLGAIASVL